uniref:Chromosome 7 open reading frame 33 n=1 Tax=Cebus imitator TaxID=2715852 RepID=A0A2K5PFS7_CEBIM
SLSLEEYPWGLPGPECECKALLPSRARCPSDLHLGGRAVTVWVHFRGSRGQFNLPFATARHKVTKNMRRGMEFIAPLSRTVRIRPGTGMGLSSDPVGSLSSNYLALLTLSYKPGRRVTSSHLNIRPEGQEVRKLQNSVEATRISRTGSS